MTQQQPTVNQQPASPISPLNPKPILQSESPTAIILAVAILLSIVFSGITSLVQVLGTKQIFR